MQHSTLIFSFPFLLFFVFSFFKNKLNKINISALILFIALGIFSTAYMKNYYKTYHFINFKGISENLVSWNNEYGKDNISHCININHPYYIDYYLEKQNEQINFKQYMNYGQKDMLELVKILNSSTTPYFSYSRCLGNISEIPDVIKVHYPFLVSYSNFGGRSETMLFSKIKSNSKISEPKKLKCFIYNYNVDSLQYQSINDLEFSSTFSEIIQQANNKYKRIKICAKAYILNNTKSIHLVVALSKKGGETYGYLSSNFSHFIETDNWGNVFLNYKIPELKYPENELKIYIWNPDKIESKIEYLNIDFYE